MNIIVAIDDEYGIGKDGKIPWKNSQDLKFFRKTTLESNVIMGRKTFESIGRPLPQRRNIVISSTLKNIEGVEIVKNLNEALELSQRKGFIIGGESIYRQALKHIEIDKIYVSKIKRNYDCDTFFPYDYMRTIFLLENIATENDLFVEVYKK